MGYYKQQLRELVANRAVELQNEFLGQFKARPVSIADTPTDRDFDILLKETYRALLGDVLDKIRDELDELDGGLEAHRPTGCKVCARFSSIENYKCKSCADKLLKDSLVA